MLQECSPRSCLFCVLHPLVSIGELVVVVVQTLWLVTMMIPVLSTRMSTQSVSLRHLVAPCLNGTQSAIVFVAKWIRTCNRAHLTDVSQGLLLCCNLIFERNLLILTMAFTLLLLLPSASSAPLVAVVVLIIVVIVMPIELSVPDLDGLCDLSRKTSNSLATSLSRSATSCCLCLIL